MHEFVRKHKKFFFVLNFIVVIGLIFFSQWLIYVKNYDVYEKKYAQDANYWRGDPYKPLNPPGYVCIWLTMFFTQTVFLRLLRGRAAPEKPLANLLWFFIFTLTSSIMMPFGSIILVSMFAQSPIGAPPQPAIKARAGDALVWTVSLMVYLHFCILMWGTTEQLEKEKQEQERLEAQKASSDETEEK